MNFFSRRRYKKQVQHFQNEARHARNMRGDVASPEQLLDMDRAEAAVESTWQAGVEKAIDKSCEQLAAAISRMYPVRTFPRIRENVEIVVVALAVAMAFRTYIIQPFKIPTGSMQPTLYGVTVKPQREAGFMDVMPFRLIPLALFGEKFVQVKAQLSGQIESRYSVEDDDVVFFINGVPHRVVKGMPMFFQPGDYVLQGQVIASGRVRLGDHIFVDKIRYNFSRPKRGDIIVFSTDKIDYPDVRHDTFYIKRLAGLPGEEVQIDPPYLVINGRKITKPFAFWRLLNDSQAGYMGYTVPHKEPGAEMFLPAPRQARVLAAGQYLPLGDNTTVSKDGRYFGPVPESSLVGPAFFVYWPFSPRFGACR